ncbi:hypothetical protein ES319_A09G184100v1 [Gossypium barbadense]|uniref:Uncharacterized protein n=2 Tax=Gossypium TaxID=3633 RepID=A0A5J5UGF7_GOSBA|nr:hypothetical protein ES319_A09G184100v1 [Gossypium barbadense]TYH03285.1 hypothetical protein ES288_A09G207500v1 [Gossypium darwinii]
MAKVCLITKPLFADGNMFLISRSRISQGSSTAHSHTYVLFIYLFISQSYNTLQINEIPLIRPSTLTYDSNSSVINVSFSRSPGTVFLWLLCCRCPRSCKPTQER